MSLDIYVEDNKDRVTKLEQGFELRDHSNRVVDYLQVKAYYGPNGEFYDDQDRPLYLCKTGSLLPCLVEGSVQHSTSLKVSEDNLIRILTRCILDKGPVTVNDRDWDLCDSYKLIQRYDHETLATIFEIECSE